MEVTIGGRDYALSETLHSDELAPIFADAWTASRVWYASQFLSEQLVAFAGNAQDDSHHSFDVADGSSVIELGSGCGLAGLVAAALGGDVLLTDQHEAVELLRRNAEQNMHTADEKRRVAVAEYAWGTQPQLPRTTYDYILVSDCINPIYGVESWRNLARSISMLSGDDTITYLAHEARGDDEAMDDFQAFSATFLSCKRIAHTRALMSESTDERSLGIGVFWGDDDVGHGPARTRLPLLQQPPTLHKRDAGVRPRNVISLPNLQHASSTELVLVSDPQSISAHDSTLSLLTVLQTLWKSIAKDTHGFIQQITDGKEISVADRKYLSAPYYSGGAYNEDRPYFLREKQAELQLETLRKQTQAYRELHCATDDHQHYFFDRRSRQPPGEVATRKMTRRDERKAIENRLIDRHEHKIQHLLSVLQTEMANETQRQIRALTYWSPHTPLSRQGRRHISTIVKERYEAADRIMRILEDYHIVIGVDAAKYLEDTIARGKVETT